MTLLSFLLVGSCMAVAIFLNSVLDKREEKKLKAKQERQQQQQQRHQS